MCRFTGSNASLHFWRSPGDLSGLGVCLGICLGALWKLWRPSGDPVGLLGAASGVSWESSGDLAVLFGFSYSFLGDLGALLGSS